MAKALKGPVEPADDPVAEDIEKALDKLSDDFDQITAEIHEALDAYSAAKEYEAYVVQDPDQKQWLADEFYENLQTDFKETIYNVVPDIQETQVQTLAEGLAINVIGNINGEGPNPAFFLIPNTLNHPTPGSAINDELQLIYDSIND